MVKKFLSSYFFWIICLFFIIKSLIVPWSFYASSSFRMGFYDLGLISTFISNIAQNKFFYVDEFELNHLSIHWTPTLIIFSPFYKIFESQYLTIFIGNLICSIGVTYFLYFIYNNHFKYEKNILYKINYVLFIVVFIFANKYLNANFLAGHFEILYTGFSLIYITLIIQNKPRIITTILLFITIGVRQDYSLFLFFLILSLFFASKKIIYLSIKTQKTLYFHMAFCLIYFFSYFKLFSHIAVKDDTNISDAFCHYSNNINDYFYFFCQNLVHKTANSSSVHFWSHLGNSWGEIITNCLSNPFLVFNSILNSGVFSFNESFLYLGLISPIQWLISLLPGTILFLAKTTDKNQLFWYNSAPLLPGLIITSVFSFILLKNYFTKLSIKSNKIFILIILSINFALLFRINRTTNSDDYVYKQPIDLQNFTKTYNEMLSICNEPQKISTHNLSYQFLKNSKTKFLLDKYTKSDMAFVRLFDNNNFNTHTCAQECVNIYNNELKTIEEDENYKLLLSNSHYKVFVNKDFLCHIQN